MDRLGFLSSMPFLVPTNSLPRSSAGRKTEVLIAPQESYHYKLSLEPSSSLAAPPAGGTMIRQQNPNQIQPAFFGRSVHGGEGDGATKDNDDTSTFDPAMANIQVVLESPADNSGIQEEHSSQNDGPSSVLKGRVLFGDKQQQQHPPGSSSSTASTPSSSHKNANHLHIQPHAFADRGPVLMFFKIDDGVFQVDGRRLQHVELLHQKSGQVAAQATESQLPPSLLLVFPCCVFRIFPMPSTPNPASDADTQQQQKRHWREQALYALQTLEKRLAQLPYHSTQAAAWSPTSSSVQTSSNEAGQKEGAQQHPQQQQQQQQSHSHSTLTSSGSTFRGNNNNKKLKSSSSSPDDTTTLLFQDNHQIRKVKRRRDALWRSRAGLQAVETILEMPLSVYTPDKTMLDLMTTTTSNSNRAIVTAAATTNMTDDSAVSECPEPKTQVHGNNNNNNNMQLEESAPSTSSSLPSMGPLLGGITEEMTNAYGTPQETIEVIQMYQRAIDESRNERLDSLLNSFFPEKRHASGKKNRARGSYYKSRRNTKHHAAGNNGENHQDNTHAAEEDDLKPVEEVMASMEILMQKQKELVEERSSFLMLPTRG